MLAKIIRSYGGHEGRRVKAGTIFAVGTPNGDLTVITLGRFRQLQQSRLAEEWVGAAAAAPAAKPAPAPRAKPDPVHRNRKEPDSTPPPPAAAAAVKVPSTRTSSRRRAQVEAPKEPRPLSRPAGGPSGTAPLASSSPAAPASNGPPLKQRGTRRGSGGSPSTTAGRSAPGPTSSTAATENGGVSITKTPGADDSAALD